MGETYAYDNAVHWSDSYEHDEDCDLDYHNSSHGYEEDWEHSAYAEIPLIRPRKTYTYDHKLQWSDSYEYHEDWYVSYEDEDDWYHNCADAEFPITRRRKTYNYDNEVHWSDSYECEEDLDLDYQNDSYTYEDEEDWDHSYAYAENLIDCNESETEVYNDDSHEAFEDDHGDDVASCLVPSDVDKDVNFKSMEEATKTVENGDTVCKNVASVTQKEKVTIEVNGFQVESVNHIFKRHSDIALAFRPKNQHIRRAYMKALLSFIKMLCQSTENISKDDLSNAEVTLVDLIDAGFKLDWLKTKLYEVSEKKKIEIGSEARIQTMEKQLQKLKLVCLDLETKLQKEQAEALAAEAPFSFNDIIC